MNCPKCGNQLYLNENFCRNCGTVFANTNNQQPVNNGYVNNSQQQSVNNTYVNNNQQPVSNTYINNNQQQPVNNTYVNNTSVPNKCKLTLTRKKAFIGFLATFKIYIDNQEVGKIKNGQTIELEVVPGNHTISIDKNKAVNIMINGNTTADVVVFGVYNYGITNVAGAGINNVDHSIDNSFLDKTKRRVNYVLIASILLPIMSIILFNTIKFYVQIWVYGIFIGYSLINIHGLKKQKEAIANEYKSLLIKSIIPIIISVISAIITIYLTYIRV